MKATSLDQLSNRATDGTGLRVAIVHARWNAEVVDALVNAAKRDLIKSGVAESDIVDVQVSGSYELPYAASRVVSNERIDAVIAVGCLIKGETMHFEYISEAVSHGLMRVQLDTGVPVVFGVLTCNTEAQAKDRAGLSKNGHNHGPAWAQTAIELARLREISRSGGCPFRPRDPAPYHELSSCPFFSLSAWLHVTALSAVGFGIMAALKKFT